MYFFALCRYARFLFLLQTLCRHFAFVFANSPPQPLLKRKWSVTKQLCLWLDIRQPIVRFSLFLWEKITCVFRHNDIYYSGTPLRPKAAKVEPHTHTKRHAGNFLWSWQAEWLAGACAVGTYVRRIS